MKQISGTDQTGHPQEEEHVADPLLDVDLSKLPFDLDEMQREQSSDLGKHVYIHHEELGYVRGKIVDIGAERLTVEAEGETVELPYGKVLPADPEGAKDVDDNCKLMNLNEGTLLENCRARYLRKQIYSYVAHILISINPYETLDDLYSSKTIAAYRGKSLGSMPPHVYAIADKAYRDMRRCKESQSIIVSGESGAGKTESQKAVLKYLCENWCSADSQSVEQLILDTNPILEAFGNAKTLRNNNSSRFGKFVEVHFTDEFNVDGGHVSHYLLEKSRVCVQQQEERNYHVFYQLFAGADEGLIQLLGLTKPQDFAYLNSGCTEFFGSVEAQQHFKRRTTSSGFIIDEVVNDFTDFQRLCKALSDIGFGPEQQLNVFKVLASILHLGNIKFEESDDIRGGCKVSEDSRSFLKKAATLLGIDDVSLLNGLTTRIMQPTKGGIKGTVIQVRLKMNEAMATRDSLAKTIYGKLFDDVVLNINNCLKIKNSKHFIGVLDIAGFEFFKNNSFEQFCINYCNEKLQQFFNDRILKQEQNLYKDECLNVPHIEYDDNSDCIDLFEKKGMGLLDLLDEEARLPRPTVQHFTTAVHQGNAGHFRLASNRNSKVKEYRAWREDECFIIRHYAGSVCYQTAQFLEKNSNTLHPSLEGLISSAQNPVIQKLFEPVESVPMSRNRLVSSSASSLFRQQLQLLLQKLKQTGTHFVRCIKPNSEMKAGLFEGGQILGQLRYAGMESVLKLMQKGFPSRTQFSEIYNLYAALLPEKLANLDPRLFCKCLFHALGLNDNEFKFGLTKVFFGPGKFSEFDQLLRKDTKAMQLLISKVQSWLCRLRWRKVQYGVWSCIKLQRKIDYRAKNATVIQAAVRGYLGRKKIAPRVRLASQCVFVRNSLSEMYQHLTDEVCADNQGLQQAKDNLKSLEDNLKGLLRETMTDCHTELSAEQSEKFTASDKETARLLGEIKELLMEKEKLKKEMLERERAREELRKKYEEEQKKEEEQRERMRQLQLKQKLILKQQQDELAKAKKEEEDQREQFDREMANRLASDKSVHIVEAEKTKAQPKKSVDPNDLTLWSFNKLRDVINTTTDIELISACRSEFHRRLRVYQNWKRTHNRQKN